MGRYFIFHPRKLPVRKLYILLAAGIRCQIKQTVFSDGAGVVHIRQIVSPRECHKLFPSFFISSAPAEVSVFIIPVKVRIVMISCYRIPWNPYTCQIAVHAGEFFFISEACRVISQKCRLVHIFPGVYCIKQLFLLLPNKCLSFLCLMFFRPEGQMQVTQKQNMVIITLCRRHRSVPLEYST